MQLLTTDLIAITIALAGSCTAILVGMKAHRELSKENRRLREQLTA